MNKLIFGVLIVVFLGSCGNKRAADAQRYLLRGNDELPNKNYSQAIRFYDDAIIRVPDFAEAYNNRGIAHYQKGDYVGAVVDYDQAILINPEYYEAYLNRVNANLQLGNLAKCESDLEIIPAAYPDSAKVDFARGLVAERRKDYDAGTSILHSGDS